MTYHLSLGTADTDTLGSVIDTLLGAVISSGIIGAGVSLVFIVATAAWCTVQQVRYRYGRVQAPVVPFAVALLIVASSAFAVIALHPASVLPARVGTAMMTSLVVVGAVLASWSLFSNLLESRIRRLHADERSGRELPLR